MKVNIGKLQFRFYVSMLEKRTGVCSQKYGSPFEHMVLWDFDRFELSEIIISLRHIQKKYKLPNIMIVQSSSKGSYHAYSFTARPLREVITVLSDTPEVDMTYLRLGMVRGYYTLRITPRKNDVSFRIVKMLWSKYPDEISPLDVTTNEYLTSNKGGHNV